MASHIRWEFEAHPSPSCLALPMGLHLCRQILSQVRWEILLLLHYVVFSSNIFMFLLKKDIFNNLLALRQTEQKT